MNSRPASGAIGNWKPAPTSVRETVETTWTTFRERAERVLEPVYSLVARLIRISRWVLTRVALLYPVRWYAWQTAHDERTCPECGAMSGRSWPEDHPGLTPPLHVNCRCRIVPHRTEWRVRYVPAWQLRTTTRQQWEWTRIGWA
jgi:SPP1 gp7 family putative phage head morphogenesis protein